MMGVLHPASKGRLLAIAPLRAVRHVLANQAGRPVVALLTSHAATGERAELEPVIVSLLDGGCHYFVCFGAASEALHDRVDELVVERALAPDRTVMTTWHDEESPAEVAEFFCNVVAASDKTLLVAVLDPNSDAELATMLVRQAST